MRKKIIFVLLAAVMSLCTAGFATACQPDGNSGDNGGSNPTDKTDVDLMLFIGQSNMAGRGNAEEAVAVGEGHAYEFRAISDPTKLYPLEEPFGANENNAASGVSEDSKTGSLVSAFCENYYQVTNTPVVAVSCSKGGTDIAFWDGASAAYADACGRMLAAQTYLKNSTEFSLRHIYAVWLQGESDGDKGTSAYAYKNAMKSIFGRFNSDFGAEHVFVIPIGGYNGGTSVMNAQYDAIRNAQIDYCRESDFATVVSIQLYDMYTLGYMKDSYHYMQSAYNIVGADAGKNAGYFVKNGVPAECENYVSDKPPVELKTGGAWQEKDGRLVIPARAALEQSVYASATDCNYKNVYYYWEAYDGALSGIQLKPNGDNQWDRNNGIRRAPQLTFEFDVTQPGTYYTYFLASHPDTGSNSVLVGLDGNMKIYCSDENYGGGIWLSNKEWFIEIDKPGRHTLHIAPREDGIILNQIVLSKNHDEAFKQFTELEESNRGEKKEYGSFIELNGAVCIDLFSAFENGEYTSKYDGAKNSAGTHWQRSINGRGVQLYPNAGLTWSADSLSVAPKLSYKVEFNTAGIYYAYLSGDCLDADSDSAFLQVDGDTPVALHRMTHSAGNGRWLSDSEWKIEISEPGIHTISLYGREDGIAFHKLYLSTDSKAAAGALEPDFSPRTLQSYSQQSTYTFFAAESGKTQYSFSVDKDGEYLVWLKGNVNDGGTLKVNVGNIEKSVTVASDGWMNFGCLELKSGQNYTLDVAAENAQYEYFYLYSKEHHDIIGLETLVFGDSYTDTIFWQDFYSQLSEIGARTIGISGSHVSAWTPKLTDYVLYNPKNIVIHIGVNDINGGKSGSACGQSIVDLIASIKGVLPETKIFYISICNNNRFEQNWGQYKTSNDIVRNYAQRTANVYFIDYAALVDERQDEWENRGFLSDNLHPSLEAYAELSELVINSVKDAYVLDEAIKSAVASLDAKFDEFNRNERVRAAYENGLAAVKLCLDTDSVQEELHKALAAMQSANDNGVLISVKYVGPFGDTIFSDSKVVASGDNYTFLTPSYLGFTADKDVVNGIASADEKITVTYSVNGTAASIYDNKGGIVPNGTVIAAYDGVNSADWDHTGSTYKTYIGDTNGITGDFTMTAYANAKFKPSNGVSIMNNSSLRLYLSDADDLSNYWIFCFPYTYRDSKGNKLGCKGSIYSETPVTEAVAKEFFLDCNVYLTVVRSGSTIIWQSIVVGGEGSGHLGESYTITCTLNDISAQTIQLAFTNRAYTEYTVNSVSMNRDNSVAINTITVTYSDEAGHILGTVNERVMSGSAYTIETPELLGYTADARAISGVADGDADFTVVYSFGGSDSSMYDNSGNPIALGTKVDAYQGPSSASWGHSDMTYKNYLCDPDGFTGDFALSVYLNTKFVQCSSSGNAGINRTVRLYVADGENAANYWIFNFLYNLRESAGDKLGATEGCVYETNIPDEKTAVGLTQNSDVLLTIVREGETFKWQAVIIAGNGSGYAGNIYKVSCTLNGIKTQNLKLTFSNRAYAEYTVYNVIVK